MSSSAHTRLAYSRRLSADGRLLLPRKRLGGEMSVRLGVPLAMMAAIALFGFTAGSVRGQGTSGTYGTLTVTGTASIGTLAVTGTTPGTGLDIQGNSVFFGSWSTNSLEPGVTYSYSDGASGTNAALTTTLTRPASTWSWLRLDSFGNAWNVMALDGSNQLILTGTQTSNPGLIVIDPTVGQITINGQTVLTANQIQNLAISSASIGSGNTVNASSIAVGASVTASGTDSSAFGYGSTASGAYSFAAGVGATAQAYDSVVLGAYNPPIGSGASWVTTDPLFTIGNGTGSSSPSTALTVLKNGNVGVGSATPVAKLDIYSSATSDILSISSTTAKLASFDNSGNLGIGAFDTGYPLFISKSAGNSEIFLRNPAQNTACVNYQSGSQWYSCGVLVGAGFGVNSLTSNAVRFFIANTTGNVGIATTAPLSKLDVNGSVAAGAYAGTAAAPANGMIVSGSVGIGTSSPQATLDVSGPVMVSGSGSAVLINPQGDLSMGPFTSGTIPQ